MPLLTAIWSALLVALVVGWALEVLEDRRARATTRAAELARVPRSVASWVTGRHGAFSRAGKALQQSQIVSDLETIRSFRRAW